MENWQALALKKQTLLTFFSDTTAESEKFRISEEKFEAKSEEKSEEENS